MTNTRLSQLAIALISLNLVFLTACDDRPSTSPQPPTSWIIPVNASITGLASIISNNGAGLISNNGAGLISNNGAGYRLLLDKPAAIRIKNKPVLLTRPDESFYETSPGKRVQGSTDEFGRYQLNAPVKQKDPLIVTVWLDGDTRLVGFRTAENGRVNIDVTEATTYVTEFLRSEAQARKKTMADFNLTSLTQAIEKTEAIIDTPDLVFPDLKKTKREDLVRQYAVAVGKNINGLGDTWATILGERFLAMTTVAGTGNSGSSGDGGIPRDATLQTPKGIAVDNKGTIYIADEGAHVIRQITNNLITTIAGTPNKTGYSPSGTNAKQALLFSPRSLTIMPRGDLLICDSQNLRVRRLSSNQLFDFIGSPRQNTDGTWINEITGDGGMALEAGLASPRGLVFSPDGQLFLNDGFNKRPFNTIRQISTTGEINLLAGIPGEEGAFRGENSNSNQALLNYVNQMVWHDGELYFTDTLNHVIRKINPKTKVIYTVLGKGGQKALVPSLDKTAQSEVLLSEPYGLAFDKNGMMVVGERGFNRIIAIDSNKTLRVLAGGGQQDQDGKALDSDLSEPHDMTFDPEGNLLITDSRNHKIRKLWLRFGI
jgi:sugar lactone lactonase YvrE